MSYNDQMNGVLKLQGVAVRAKTSQNVDANSIFSTISIAACPITPIAPVSSISAFVC
ncbi:hypothetical protein [Alkalihalophilus marmarensis]|uniref:Uncharacterized protein n=1 Tax=Alkalihalophilus marmarensis DSM 21297 TaxID=1188261 RepID=U6SN18_9BACI|nr:hypothetical protein [Alkalihalophilus marmarensis]ERN52021.1 hypothetical protein A33I_18180 [Alkalihalophilus marmarensis DSM 21297]